MATNCCERDDGVYIHDRLTAGRSLGEIRVCLVLLWALLARTLIASVGIYTIDQMSLREGINECVSHKHVN